MVLCVGLSRNIRSFNMYELAISSSSYTFFCFKALSVIAYRYYLVHARTNSPTLDRSIRAYRHYCFSIRIFYLPTHCKNYIITSICFCFFQCSHFSFHHPVTITSILKIYLPRSYSVNLPAGSTYITKEKHRESSPVFSLFIIIH